LCVKSVFLWYADCYFIDRYIYSPIHLTGEQLETKGASCYLNHLVVVPPSLTFLKGQIPNGGYPAAAFNNYQYYS
jgi:hypothetical protein